MLHIEDQQLRSMSESNIRDLMDKFKSELQRRENVKREKAIEDFKKAFSALQDAGIRVYGVYDYSDQLTFNSWDDFYFD